MSKMDDSHKMGLVGATSYVIGNIIGSGIFITPASILRCTDSVGLSLLVWIGCAVIAILGALCYIELGTSIREAGCDFAYICYVKWYSIAFAFMWVSTLMTYPATIAIIAETFGQYLIEGLKQVYDIDEALIPTAQKLFGFSLLWLVTWMNFFSLSKFAARFQIVATVAKLLACCLIIVTGFYYMLVRGWTYNLREPMRGSNYRLGDLVMGTYGGLWAFSGWDILNYGAGEISRPRRNVPLALLGGIGVVTLVYVSINVAYFVVLDVETVKSSNAVAALFSQATLGPFASFIPFLIGILLLGSLNSNLFSGSRYMYAAARQGHLPAMFSCVNKETDSPRVAIFAQTALAVGISFVGDLDSLISYCMFAFWAQRIFTLVALLIIRHCRVPVHPEAIQMPLFVIYLFLAVTIALVVIPIIQEFEITALAIGLLVVGFIFYFVFVNPKRLPSFCYRWNEQSTIAACVMFDCLPDLKEGVGRSSRSLGTSDSTHQLLAKRSCDSRLSSSDEFPILPPETDLHSDEKNLTKRTTIGMRIFPPALVDLIDSVQ